MITEWSAWVRMCALARNSEECTYTTYRCCRFSSCRNQHTSLPRCFQFPRTFHVYARAMTFGMQSRSFVRHCATLTCALTLGLHALSRYMTTGRSRSSEASCSRRSSLSLTAFPNVHRSRTLTVLRDLAFITATKPANPSSRTSTTHLLTRFIREKHHTGCLSFIRPLTAVD